MDATSAVTIRNGDAAILDRLSRPEQDDLSPDAVAGIVAMAGPAAHTPLLMVEIRQLGGALGKSPAIPDAVGARDVLDGNQIQSATRRFRENLPAREI